MKKTGPKEVERDAQASTTNSRDFTESQCRDVPFELKLMQFPAVH
jgi:hypothetical protein